MNKVSPIIAFVHVPKTAGSTVNHYLERSRAPGQAHVESLFSQSHMIRGKIAGYDWVSGHVPYPKMRATLTSVTFRDIHFFTAIRAPDAQVMSHFNWLIEIRKRGRSFYNAHPPQIKEISERIRAADTSDPRQVIDLLHGSRQLFLNFQSQMVLGKRHPTTSLDELEQRLQVYEMIATEATLPTLIERVSGQAYQPKKRKNVSPYHFPKDVFQDQRLLEFLHEENACDFALYDFVQSRSAEQNIR